MKIRFNKHTMALWIVLTDRLVIELFALKPKKWWHLFLPYYRKGDEDDTQTIS